jgi:hypothetical protein
MLVIEELTESSAVTSTPRNTLRLKASPTVTPATGSKTALQSLKTVMVNLNWPGFERVSWLSVNHSPLFVPAMPLPET